MCDLINKTVHLFNLRYKNNHRVQIDETTKHRTVKGHYLYVPELRFDFQGSEQWSPFVGWNLDYR